MALTTSLIDTVTAVLTGWLSLSVTVTTDSEVLSLQVKEYISRAEHLKQLLKPCDSNSDSHQLSEQLGLYPCILFSLAQYSCTFTFQVFKMFRFFFLNLQFACS